MRLCSIGAVPHPWKFVGSPHHDTLGSHLLRELANEKWTRLDAAVAFVKMSGVKQIGAPLYDFASRARVRLTVGIDHQGSSLEGIRNHAFWLILGGAASDLYVLQNPAGSPRSTFHPKMWLFRSDSEALLICGSGNLTGGGLFRKL